MGKVPDQVYVIEEDRAAFCVAFHAAHYSAKLGMNEPALQQTLHLQKASGACIHTKPSGKDAKRQTLSNKSRCTYSLS